MLKAAGLPLAHAAILDRITRVVGPQGLITDPRDLEPYIADWRGLYRGATAHGYGIEQLGLFHPRRL